MQQVGVTRMRWPLLLMTRVEFHDNVAMMRLQRYPVDTR